MSATYQRMQYSSGFRSPHSREWKSSYAPYSHEWRSPYVGFGTSSMSGAKSSGWTSTLVLAGAIGVGVVGYLLYRQFYVSAGTVRGAKHALGWEGV
jgi:hypothetical protein